MVRPQGRLFLKFHFQKKKKGGTKKQIIHIPDTSDTYFQFLRIAMKRTYKGGHIYAVIRSFQTTLDASGSFGGSDGLFIAKLTEQSNAESFFCFFYANICIFEIPKYIIVRKG